MSVENMRQASATEPDKLVRIHPLRAATNNRHNLEWIDPTPEAAARSWRQSDLLADLFLHVVRAYLADNTLSSPRRTANRVANWLGVDTATAYEIIGYATAGFRG